MATELTVKERAFAQLIIEGTKVAAYRKVYSDRGSVATQTVNAYKFARKPKIKAEVARLLRQRGFPADDYARIRDLAVAGLTEIFLQESDPRLRAKVGAVLLAYADAGLKLHPVPTTKEREYDELITLINEIEEGGKANSEIVNATNQVIVDATREGAAGIVAEEFGVLCATATRMDLMQGANEIEPAGEGDAEVQRSAPLDSDRSFEPTHTAMLPAGDFPGAKPEPETGRSDQGELSVTETESEARSFEEDIPERPQYRWQAVPGRFPTVRRRVLAKTVDKKR